MSPEIRSLTDVQPEVAASAPLPPPPAGPPAMSPVELGRWAWRQLTSMRTALILLFLLALAAIPGSVVPQEAVDSLRASRWKADHPGLTPIYERLGLFDVYGSPWFAAIYLLLVSGWWDLLVADIRGWFFPDFTPGV